jgi:hypothetical protein
VKQIWAWFNSVGLGLDCWKPYDVEHKRIIKYREDRSLIHIHIYDTHNFELTLYPADKVHYVFKTSVTGEAIDRASIAELESLLGDEYTESDLEEELEQIDYPIDPIVLYHMLLEPLAIGKL